MAEREESAAQGMPDLGGLLAGLLGGAGAAGTGGGTAGADALSSVLNDPQMMARLPAVIDMLRPMVSGGAEERPAPPAAEGAAAAAPTEARAHAQRTALLRAVRPYVNPRRREVIDYMLRMEQLGGMFRGG